MHLLRTALLVIAVAACGARDRNPRDQDPLPGDRDGYTAGDRDTGSGDDATGGDERAGGDDTQPVGGDAEGGLPFVEDPASALNTPGAYGGAECPASSETVFTISDSGITSRIFSGYVDGAVGHGIFYVRGDAGEELGGTLETIGGSYSVHIPLFCGRQLVKLHWQGATCPLTLVYEVTISSCTKAELRLTIVWDELGDDWELHLIKPGGTINDADTDCTWNTCRSVQPDWGVIGDTTDDPKKDVDDLDTYGPESIYLPRLETGEYTIMVEHWGPGDPGSDGRLFINAAGQLIIVEKHNLPYMSVWKAATVSGGTVETSQEVYDCSADWSGGCRAQLP
jgi:hypothetical protein